LDWILKLSIRRGLNLFFDVSEWIEGSVGGPQLFDTEIVGRDFLSETKPHENPLIPNKKLRELFVAMVEMRVLDEHIASLQRGAKARRRLESTRGEEACRVSMAIDLVPGDLVSDAQVSVAMGLLAGVKVGELMREVAALGSSAEMPATKVAARGAAERELPWIENVGDRLRMAMGAALSFKTLKRTNVVVAYIREGEVSNGMWRRVLTLASKLELPIIFVVLPGSGKKKKGDEVGALSAKARSCGVPGIPVDSSDAVALYRVAQESLGRMRGGDGPVLVECVAFSVKGRRRNSVVDPLVLMREFLLGRKVCSEAWLDRAGDRLTRQIGTKPGRVDHPFQPMASKLE
jgi:TPP-dependent pyruvate/acetoin dehydrogenase alpha subunit